MRYGLAAVALLPACYSPSYRDCEVTCSEGVCPSGLACSAGVCRPPGMTGPCGGSMDDAQRMDTGGDADPSGSTWGFARSIGSAPQLDLRDPTLTLDRMVIYASVADNIVTSSRSAGSMVFTSFSIVSNISTNMVEEGPDVTADHMAMYFIRETLSDRDIHIATRDPTTGSWSAGAHVVELDSVGESSANPSVTPDGMTCVFENLDLSPRLYLATRQNNMWQPAVGMSGLADKDVAQSPALSPDKLTLYYSKRVGAQTDIFEAKRATLASPFSTGTPVTGGVNTATDEDDPWISPDNNTLVFVRRNPTSLLFEIHESSRL